METKTISVCLNWLKSKNLLVLWCKQFGNRCYINIRDKTEYLIIEDVTWNEYNKIVYAYSINVDGKINLIPKGLNILMEDPKIDILITVRMW